MTAPLPAHPPEELASLKRVVNALEAQRAVSGAAVPNAALAPPCEVLRQAPSTTLWRRSTCGPLSFALRRSKPAGNNWPDRRAARR
jgi:hypothetical protein